MIIDYNKISKEAYRMGISPHLLIKRKINYRKHKKKEADCRFCNNLRFFGENIDYQRKQCEIIGVNWDKNADVDYLHICNFFEKIECVKRFDYKLFFKEKKNESN